MIAITMAPTTTAVVAVPDGQTEFKWNDDHWERLVVVDHDTNYTFACPYNEHREFTVNTSEPFFSQEFFDAYQDIECDEPQQQTAKEIMERFADSIANAKDAMESQQSSNKAPNS